MSDREIPLFDMWDSIPGQDVLICALVGPGLKDPTSVYDGQGRLNKLAFCPIRACKEEAVKDVIETLQMKLSSLSSWKGLKVYDFYTVPMRTWNIFPPNQAILEKRFFSDPTMAQIAEYEIKSRIKAEVGLHERIASMKAREQELKEEAEALKEQQKEESENLKDQ